MTKVIEPTGAQRGGKGRRLADGADRQFGVAIAIKVAAHQRVAKVVVILAPVGVGPSAQVFGQAQRRP